jgi:hypothetical protein
VSTRSDYRVRYVLPESRISDSLASESSRDVQMETVVTADYEGRQRDDLTYLQLDVSKMPAGVHKLSVQIVDRHTGKMVNRAVLFRVVE